MSETTTVSQRFKEIRKYLGYNQKDFASELGISQTHVSSIEHEKDNPSSPLLKLICYKFNINEEWIVNGKGSRTPEFNVFTDDGLQSKYNMMRTVFERWLKTKSGDELQNSVEAFSRFVSLVGMKKLSPQNEKEYLKNVFFTISFIEGLVSDTYLLKGLDVKKKDYQTLLRYKTESQEAIDDIVTAIKSMTNIYLDEYDLDIKL